MIAAFFYGVILAFGLILPLGPQNMFILAQGGNTKQFRHTLPAVITASLSDTILIVLASFGVSLFILQHVMLEKILLIAGMMFLTYLGGQLWYKAERGHIPTLQKKSLSAKKQILFCASVSLLNPHAILDTVAVIGVNAMLFKGGAHISFTVACILVSWLWFISLALFGKWISRFTQFKFYQDRLSALVIWFAAITLLVRFLRI